MKVTRKLVRSFLSVGWFLTFFYIEGYSIQCKVDSIPFIARYSISSIAYNTQVFDPGQVCGTIHDSRIGEASGLACGSRNRDVLYLINDHGNKNILFLLNHKGANKGAFYINGFPDRDWEDIAVGDNLKQDIPYIYIADIGDNSLRYKEVFIYRIKEPPVPKEPDKVDRLSGAEKYVMVYPDGPHNAETFLVDPISKNWYIFTKGDRSRVYCAEYPQNSHDTIHLRYLGLLPFSHVTAGSVTGDGMELLLKNYENIYYWRRKNDKETISRLLQTRPSKIPYKPEVHGESIGWIYDASGFFTTSERRTGTGDPLIYFYERKK